MTLQAVPARTFGDQIFSQLAAEILTGRYLPGENLPSERSLAEALQVNRQVVREALKRLAQVGLTSIQQGGGNRVLDFRRSAGLDLMALMAEHANVTADVGDYWQSVLEMRVAVCSDLVRLCALRATPLQKRELAVLSDALRNAASDDERSQLEERFWVTVQEGAKNIAYQLAFNTMRRSALALGERTVQWNNFELRITDYRQTVVEAINAGNADLAESECRRGMREALTIYERKRAEQGARSETPSSPDTLDPEAENPLARTLRALDRTTRSGRRKSAANAAGEAEKGE